MSEERCENCRFWLPNKSNDIERINMGICRRYPPTVRFLDYIPKPLFVLPETDPRCWCGEWRAAARPGQPREV
jgi:hypothetical protein